VDNLLGTFERQLCDIQGRLFERALEKGLDCEDFMTKFMNSATVEFLDMPYDRLQWAGEEYVLAQLLDEVIIEKSLENQYSDEVMFWSGYTYRYWHFLTQERSKDIYIQANAKTMKECYLGFHTLDVSMAIEDLKEIYKQKIRL